MDRDRDRDELLTDVLDTHVTFLFIQSLRHNVVFYRTSLGLLGHALLSGDTAERNFATLVVNLGLTLVHNLRPVPEIQFSWFIDRVGLKGKKPTSPTKIINSTLKRSKTLHPFTYLSMTLVTIVISSSHYCYAISLDGTYLVRVIGLHCVSDTSSHSSLTLNIQILVFPGDRLAFSGKIRRKE